MMSQPFTYIMALVVIAMIVGFGFYLVQKLMGTANLVDIAKFNIDLQNDVTNLNLASPGSADMVDLPVPQGIKTICFADTKSPLTATLIEDETVATDIANYADTDRNVFFGMATEKYTPLDPATIKLIKPSPNPLCIDVLGGRLKAGIENKGKNVVMISSAE